MNDRIWNPQLSPLQRAIWGALEPYLDTCIKLDLNSERDNSVFLEMVTRVEAEIAHAQAIASYQTGPTDPQPRGMQHEFRRAKQEYPAEFARMVQQRRQDRKQIVRLTDSLDAALERVHRLTKKNRRLKAQRDALKLEAEVQQRRSRAAALNRARIYDREDKHIWSLAKIAYTNSPVETVAWDALDEDVRKRWYLATKANYRKVHRSKKEN